MFEGLYCFLGTGGSRDLQRRLLQLQLLRHVRVAVSQCRAGLCGRQDTGVRSVVVRSHTAGHLLHSAVL